LDLFFPFPLIIIFLLFPQCAVVEFKIPYEAQAAISSPDAILGNRFVKVYFEFFLWTFLSSLLIIKIYLLQGNVCDWRRKQWLIITVIINYTIITIIIFVLSQCRETQHIPHTPCYYLHYYYSYFISSYWCSCSEETSPCTAECVFYFILFYLFIYFLLFFIG
jgi:hypothetical protein